MCTFKNWEGGWVGAEFCRNANTVWVSTPKSSLSGMDSQIPQIGAQIIDYLTFSVFVFACVCVSVFACVCVFVCIFVLSWAHLTRGWVSPCDPRLATVTPRVGRKCGAAFQLDENLFKCFQLIENFSERFSENYIFFCKYCNKASGNRSGSAFPTW